MATTDKRKIFRIGPLIALLSLLLGNCTQYDMLEKLESPGAAIGLKVFVSSLVSGGNFAELGGAFEAGGCTGNDILRAICVCQHLATNAGLARGNTQFIPWLSSASGTAVDARCLVQGQNNITCGTNDSGPWYNTKNKIVTKSLNDLLMGAMQNPIQYSENGVDMSGVEVMTGTLPNGTSSSNHCSSWTMNSIGPPLTLGDSGQTGPGWTNNKVLSDCGTKRPIYCFEVKK